MFIWNTSATSLNIHVPYVLSRTMMSGLLLGMFLLVRTYYYYYYYYYYYSKYLHVPDVE